MAVSAAHHQQIRFARAADGVRLAYAASGDGEPVLKAATCCRTWRSTGTAPTLGLSEKTVRNQVSAIFDKLEVESRAQAIVRAREAGFGKGEVR